ncbi:MAG: bifunctional oligoribonuclease/PAP phosphatase NrnA [Tomitella sp.]|nr:bifunctional oligoribonuclease/PAP phosphatase NrnA [Tomitella sp.]
MDAATARPITAAEAVQYLCDAESVTVLSHVHPDADTLGSALAVATALSRAGTAVRVSFPGPHVLPRSLRLLPGLDHIVEPDQLDESADLVVVVDCSSADRLGELAGHIHGPGTTLVIDHHRTNTGFGDSALVDPHSQSTTVIVTTILRKWGVGIDVDIAQCLYAGLVTDTGGLSRADTTSLRLAADLLETGFDGAELLRGLMDSHPYAWLPMLGTVLARAELDRDAVAGRGLVHTVIRIDDAQHVGWEEVESVVDIVRTAEEAEVAVVLKEQPGGRWAVSMRSRGAVDVAETARSLGGGGHHSAAGYSAHGSREAVLIELRAALG